MQHSPVRLSPDRIRLYGIGLALIGIAQIRFSGSSGFWDWGVFRSAGQLVGSRELLGIGFVYTPGFAWLLKPAAYASLAVGFWSNAALMLAALTIGGLLASRIYRLTPSFAIVATLAWTPVMYAIVVGQNAPLALLCYVAAIWAYSKNDAIGTGIAIGILLYKPTYALPLILLMAVRRDWRVLATAFVCAGAWYVASAAATGWNFSWPVPYAHSLASYYGSDFSGNTVKALSVPALLMRVGVLPAVSISIGALVLFAGAVRLSKAEPQAAMSLAGILGIASSPHAWTYDAALMLPAFFYVMTSVAEPWRTRSIVAAYVLGAGWLLENTIAFNPLAIIAIAGALFAIAVKPARDR